MRSVRLLIGVAVLLALPPAADAVRSGGHNPPTRKLEIAFKVAGGVRAGRKDGCYAAPRRMAALIHHWGHLEAEVTRGFGAVRTPNVVYVIGPRASCERMVFALLDRGKVFILDTAAGDVYRRGQGPNRRGAEAARFGRGPLRRLTLSSKPFSLRKADRAKRLVIGCPKGSFPLGGGMTNAAQIGPDGEGIYPHSYERLGVQRGFHVTALIIDPTPRDTVRRWATLQVVCGRGLVPLSSPHRTVFVRRNETNTATASCPPGQYLFGGGFQRTNYTTPFRTYGGNYITESRAVSTTAWRVTAKSVGWDGGELTAIAYCARDPSLPLVEVQGTAKIAAGQSGVATTPPCPPGTELTSGGFSFNGSDAAFFADGSLNQDGTWSASGFGYFGPVTGLTAYGYCLRPADAAVTDTG
ncbi:MAG TPA: hypothetical protein VH329_03595 [Solirubrobacterales bacterium]|jgi:hypothetical protein